MRDIYALYNLQLCTLEPLLWVIGQYRDEDDKTAEAKSICASDRISNVSDAPLVSLRNDSC